MRAIGKDRVAGFDADVVQLVPRDGLRFGYRVWSERRSGLVVKLQTLDGDSKVVEQSAFSELQLDAPVKAHALAQMMGNTAGYRVEKSELERTTAEREGWALRQAGRRLQAGQFFPAPVAMAGGDAKLGAYHAMDLHGWPGLGVAVHRALRCAAQARRSACSALGATYTLTRRLTGKDGDWWLTAVGEVPPQTLQSFRPELRSR